MDGGKRARLPSGTQGVVSVTACNPTSNAAYRRYVRRFWPAEDYHQDFARRRPANYEGYLIGCRREARLRAVWGT